MKLIVGLGNPDIKYQNARHNLGFKVVDKYVSCIMYHVSWEDNKKLKSQVAKINELVIAKPQTYMNNSGLAVKLLVSYYKIAPADIIVVHDELDLPLGKIKVRLGGAAAGHHGVASIINALSTDQFVRVRLGIGNEKSWDFVLERFLPSEQTKVSQMVKQAVKAVEILIDQDLEAAQNRFN